MTDNSTQENIKVITCIKDNDGNYDISAPLRITEEQWVKILTDIMEAKPIVWSMLREIHRAKNYTAYVRDIAAKFQMQRPEVVKMLDEEGHNVANRIGGFRIVRRLNPNSECWWPVFFYMSVVPDNEIVYRLRMDTVRVMDKLTKTNTRKRNSESTGRTRASWQMFSFFEMGLDVGDKWIFIPDRTITATVVSSRKVICNGRETYLTPLTTQLRGKDSNMAQYWEFNGKTLHEIYLETYYPQGKPDVSSTEPLTNKP